MPSVLHLRKELTDPPVAVGLEGVNVRTLQVPDDVPAWLALRDRATADLLPRPRFWNEHDFRNEMLSKSWWRSDRTWFAIAGELRLAGEEGPATRRSPAIASTEANKIIGTVTLALREGAAGSVPIIHWLLVEAAWRRRGIGRLLVSQLERAAWDEGFREVQLETHAGWLEAVAFYHSIGYAPVRERSPR
jgi:GNAT superfamily N-acetyltransferase